VLFLLGSLIAVVLGHRALRQIEENRGWLTGRKAAVAGLTIGYITLIPGSVALFIASVFMLAYVTRAPQPTQEAAPTMSSPDVQDARPTKSPDSGAKRRRPVGGEAQLGPVGRRIAWHRDPGGMEEQAARTRDLPNPALMPVRDFLNVAV